MIDLDNIRRNSGISLDRSGRFLHEEEPIENERIQALFRKGIVVREDGEVTLHVGNQWCYVKCEGVAVFVHTVAVDDDGVCELTLSDGTRERLLLDTLIAVENNDLYCFVKERRVAARFLRGAYHQLAPHLVAGDSEQAVAWYVQLGGARTPVLSAEVPPGVVRA